MSRDAISVDPEDAAVKFDVEKYIGSNHYEFLYSLTPIHLTKGPKIVRLMTQVSEKAGVGPMAAVASALADLV